MIPSEEFERMFTREQKVALGKQCKIVLDTARTRRLKTATALYSVQFVHYTVSPSLENNHSLAVLDGTKDKSETKLEWFHDQEVGDLPLCMKTFNFTGSLGHFAKSRVLPS